MTDGVNGESIARTAQTSQKKKKKTYAHADSIIPVVQHPRDEVGVQLLTCLPLSSGPFPAAGAISI